MINTVYSVFGFEYTVELSTRPEDSMGDDSVWEMAEGALKKALEHENMPYVINEGDGAFYGPKIDFHIKDCLGREWQCGTIQLDFQMPERFDLTYIGDSVEKIGYKIRNARLEKVPYFAVIGAAEENENTLAITARGGEKLGSFKIDEFLDKVTKEIDSKI